MHATACRQNLARSATGTYITKTAYLNMTKKKTTKHKVTVKVRPQVKQRPRLTRGRKAYTPAKTLIFERTIREAWDGPTWDVPVSLNVVLNKDSIVITVQEIDVLPSPLRGDIDNYVKSIMDGLNGAAYTDDKLVRKLTVVKK